MRKTREIFGRNEMSDLDEIQRERRLWEDEVHEIEVDDLFNNITKTEKERIKDYEKRGII